MPSDRIIHYKPNGLHYFHLKQLKHLTEWQLTGTFQQNDLKRKNTMGGGKETLRLLITFFFLAGSF